MKKSTIPLALIVGENIRHERMRQSISQERLAEQAQISSQYLSLLENGDRCGSLRTYYSIATELSLQISELFLRSKEDANCSTDERSILNLFCGCSPVDRRVMVAVLAAVKSALHTTG